MTPAVISDNSFESENAGQLSCLGEIVFENNEFSVTNVGLMVSTNPAIPSTGIARNNHVTGAITSPLNIGGHGKPYAIEWTNNTANGLPVIVVTGAVDALLDGGGISVAALHVIDAVNTTVKNWRSETIQSYTVQQPVQIIRGTNITFTENLMVNGGLRSLEGSDHKVIGNTILNGSLRIERPNTVLVANNTIDTWREALILWHAKAGSQTVLDSNYIVSGNSCTVCATYAGGLTAIGNTFRNTARDAPIVLMLDESSVFRNNTIIGRHGVGGIVRTYPIAGEADARWNWWGSSEGPQVSEGDVLVDPWLLAPPS
jgi:hypothetical protein